MTPRQPVELVFNVRCQFQLKHHWLGKNEKRCTTVLSPLLLVSRGFFVFVIALVVVLVLVIENVKSRTSTRTRRKN
jgi:hypothetical protein